MSINSDEQVHAMKLSIDVISTKDLALSANIQVKYSLKLAQLTHSFKSAQPTAVKQGNQTTELVKNFASYEFAASKSQLFEILAGNQNFMVSVCSCERGQGGGMVEKEIGTSQMSLKELLSAPLSQTPQAMARVNDSMLSIADRTGKKQGLLRVIVYLEDFGLYQASQTAPSAKATAMRTTGVISGGGKAANIEQSPDYQVVWELEMWKRSEEAKFKAHLKQVEIAKIEELTQEWRGKEMHREQLFEDSCKKVSLMEGKIRQKATDLEKRERKIVDLEEELAKKIGEVSRALTGKEEEIISIKRRFKEERVNLDADKKRLKQELSEYQDKLDQAHNRFFGLKKEYEDSPLSTLRSELGQRDLTILELESQVKTATQSRDEYQGRYDKIRKDHLVFKKQIDREKADQLAKQAHELEQLKTMMRNNQARDEERKEMDNLRNALQSHNTRQNTFQPQPGQIIQETDTSKKQSCHRPQRAVLAPPDRNIYIDDFARQQESPIKDKIGAGISGGASEWERLMTERQDLIANCGYTEDDVVIREFDKTIQEARTRGGEMGASPPTNGRAY